MDGNARSIQAAQARVFMMVSLYECRFSDLLLLHHFIDDG